MGFVSFIQSIFCKDLINQIATLQNEIPKEDDINIINDFIDENLK